MLLQFVALVRDSNKQKMSSLLNQFGLASRMCEKFDDLKERIEDQIDYCPINKQIEGEAKKSLEYLRANTCI